MLRFLRPLLCSSAVPAAAVLAMCEKCATHPQRYLRDAATAHSIAADFAKIPPGAATATLIDIVASLAYESFEVKKALSTQDSMAMSVAVSEMQHELVETCSPQALIALVEITPTTTSGGGILSRIVARAIDPQFLGSLPSNKERQLLLYRLLKCVAAECRRAEKQQQQQQQSGPTTMEQHLLGRVIQALETTLEEAAATRMPPTVALRVLCVLGGMKNRKYPAFTRRLCFAGVRAFEVELEAPRTPSNSNKNNNKNSVSPSLALDSLKACVGLWFFPAAFCGPLLRYLTHACPAFSGRQIFDACLCLNVMSERDALTRKQAVGVADVASELRLFSGALERRAQEVELTQRQARIVVIALSRAGSRCTRGVLEAVVVKK